MSRRSDTHQAGVSLEALEQRVVELEARGAADQARITELERLVARLEQEHERSQDDRDSVVLAAVATSANDLAFTAASVVDRARLEPELHATLLAAGADTPWRLGTWLRSLRGRTIAGLRLERLGKGDAGAIWIIRADGPAAHSQVPPCARRPRGLRVGA